MTLRLDDELGAALRIVAAVDDKGMTTIIRELVAEHIERRRADKEFIERLGVYQQEQNELYERLARTT